MKSGDADVFIKDLYARYKAEAAHVAGSTSSRLRRKGGTADAGSVGHLSQAPPQNYEEALARALDSLKSRANIERQKAGMVTVEEEEEAMAAAASFSLLSSGGQKAEQPKCQANVIRQKS